MTAYISRGKKHGRKVLIMGIKWNQKCISGKLGRKKHKKQED